MCCTSEPAKLSNTILFGAETEVDGVYHHVLGYQNRAENKSNKPNCMILPIPAKNELGPQSIIDTSSYKQILSLYAERFPKDTRRMTKSLSLSFGFDDDNIRSKVQVFDSGNYTVVLSKNLDAIQQALELVPENKRPTIRPELLESFKTLYPDDWQYAFCCFDGTVEAEPLVWVYEPLNPTQIFVPALDAHDGGAPNFSEKHQTQIDHTVMFASHRVAEAKPIYKDDLYRYKVDVYRNQDVPEDKRYAFPPVFAGATYQNSSPVNGDFWFDTSNFDKGVFSSVRVTPPLFKNMKQKLYQMRASGQTVSTGV